ncbi:MAG: TonB-dependent receptor, partial [Bacteroidales bacterium]|nr:TonB-dependent receptor [Bacteroidales bacterium]
MIRILLYIFFLCGSVTMTAQTSFTISGSVQDSDSKESLVGANVYLKETVNGMAADVSGRFRFSEKQGKYTLICSYIGYEQYEETIVLNKNLTVNILLKPIKFIGETVEIFGDRLDKNVRSADIGVIELPMKRIEIIPVLFGETDILKTMQLLPGIQSGGEGSNSFYVRGGGADQNLILLDNATVYNPSHLFGFFSVFNGDIINTAEILKGGIAPEFGGRMSSVLNITSKDGDFQKHKGELGVGLISARVKAEGPIQKNKSSFMLSGRRTYIDVLLKPFSKGTDMEGIGYHFYDLNGKMTFRLSKKDHLFVSGYYGRDVFGFHPKDANMNNDINWSNGFATIRWAHFFDHNISLNTSAIFTDYRFYIKAKEDVYNMKLYSGVQDWELKSDLTWEVDPLNKLKGGVDYIFHTFTPTTASASSNDVDFNLGDPEKMYAHDLSFYAQHEYDPLDWLKVVYGVRYNYFAQV